ncbi:MAG: sugar transferase [Bacilli bacterium]|nr:sugar transferase [Bacilli bacterium]
MNGEVTTIIIDNDDIIRIKEITTFTKTQNTAYTYAKRSFDIICALVGCLILLPLMIVVKILYCLSGDFDTIFYEQERIGKDGKLFKLYKFRTMEKDADEKLFKYLQENEQANIEYKRNKKLKNDPRITKVGKILRKCSLDEFPQLINCLFGQMSVIGNRPYLPREQEDMENYYYDIIKTKPGITGYWQISGRSDVSFKKRLELEQFYSNNYSLSLDIKIFFKTFSVVLFGRGAE